MTSKYISLLKCMLTDFHRIGKVEYKAIRVTTWKLWLLSIIDKILRPANLAITKVVISTMEARMMGDDHPAYADTMIGMRRLNNLEHCITEVIRKKVKGDFIETGVWRGGACIFMKAMLNELEVRDRKIFVADSFEGLPKPDKGHTTDVADKLWANTDLAISLEQVQDNFNKYELLDDNVIFLKGWFKDTLPTAPITKLAILRLDGDMYSSTMDALNALYSKVSPGGYVIVDDYYAVRGCRQAIDHFRYVKDIHDPIIRIDNTAVYWVKGKK